MRTKKFAAALTTVGFMFVLIASAAGQAPEKTDTIAGFYECRGNNPDGTSYEGVVEIIKAHNTFRIRWTLSDGLLILGVGILNGDVFAVSYFGGTPAIVLYKVEENRLVGEWTMWGIDGQVFSEILTRMKEQPKPQEPKPPSAPGRQVKSVGVVV